MEALGQSNLEGTYCDTYPVDGGSSCFKFNSDGHFIYYTAGCLGLFEYATGIYKLDKDQVLQLNVLERGGNHSIDVVDRPEKFPDKVVIRFTVANEFGMGLQSTIIRKGADLREFVFEHNMTDSDGILEWLLEKKDKKQILDLDVNPGPEDIFFEIDQSKSQDVLITIFSGNPELHKSYTLRYENKGVFPEGFYLGDRRFYKRN